MKQTTSVLVTDEHHLAMSWCFKNNIKIYPKVVKDGYRIEVNDNGKIIRSPKIYTKSEMESKVGNYICIFIGIYIFTQFMVAPLGLIILTKRYAKRYLQLFVIILIFMNNRDRQKQDSYRITFYAMIAIIGLFLIEIIRSA
jgi:hypothetical protein